MAKGGGGRRPVAARPARRADDPNAALIIRDKKPGEAKGEAELVDRFQGMFLEKHPAGGEAPEMAKRLPMAQRLRLQADARMGGAAGKFKGGGFRGGREMSSYEPPMVVREFAHVHKPAADGLRSDFTETVYWHPVLVLPKDGKADVSFNLSESVTS